MTEITGGQALIRSLYIEGVRVVFGLPGMGQYEATDALFEEPGMRYIATRHEQATSYMADAYARVSGHIAAVLVVPGSGLFNASAGIATADAVSSPMLVITGTQHHRPPTPDGDASAWLRPLTKWAARATRPSEIPSAVHAAFRQLGAGRPRPVAIEIPAQAFAAREEVQFLEPTPSVNPVNPVSCFIFRGGPPWKQRELAAS